MCFINTEWGEIALTSFNFKAMSHRQRYLVTYTSSKPNEPAVKTYGVYAKKHSQAINEVRLHINTNGLHNSKDHSFDLKAEPSFKKADVEISDEVLVDD